MPDIPSDVFFSTIGELSARLRAKDFSCLELTRAFCDRLERVGPRYNALALSLREQALRQARDVDGDFKRGRTRSPLQGIPFGAPTCSVSSRRNGSAFIGSVSAKGNLTDEPSRSDRSSALAP